MAHHSGQPLPGTHSGQPPPRLLDLVRQIQEKQGQPVGPTGQFPQGKLHDTDEGELRLAVTKSNGKVVVDFGKPVVWIGFDAAQAVSLGELLIKHGKDME